MNFLLTKTEKIHISKHIEYITYESMGINSYLTTLRKIGYNYLPERILNALEMQKSGLNIEPYIIIDNLPIDSNITGSPNFIQSGRQFKSGSISENILIMIGAILGEPYSIFFEGRELVNNLTPQPESSHQFTGLGSAVELDLHIENSALRFLGGLDYSPLGILLLGVREQKNNNGVPYTNVADSRLALKMLSQHDINILKSNSYLIKLPYRWRQAFANFGDSTEPCPMVSGDMQTLVVNAVFYPDMVIALTDEAELALHNFYTALRAIMLRVSITPGKLVYVDNKIALHSRDKFEAHYDENGSAYRWIQRLFIMESLRSLRKFSKIGQRVFNPDSGKTQKC